MSDATGARLAAPIPYGLCAWHRQIRAAELDRVATAYRLGARAARSEAFAAMKRTNEITKTCPGCIRVKADNAARYREAHPEVIP